MGAQKAATSWLFVNLQRHHQIWMPPVKELHFFNHLFVPENRSWTGYHMRQGAANALKHHVKNSENIDFQFVRYLARMMEDTFTEEWYRATFDRPGARGKVLGDITPEYSTLPEEGIDYVRRLLGTPKIIYIIRDPVGRALSQLRMNLSRHPQDNMQEADWREAAQNWDILNRGDYKSYIPRWKSRFAEADMLFLPYGDVASDPVGVLKRVQEFLGLEPFKSFERTDEKVHKTKSVSVPAYVPSLYSEIFADQVKFIEKEFGTDFLARTK
ncbi:sulfotransferase family protein [Rhizobium alvei]|uniref:Sulfotransferase n=1 Tax=Rhizobium alvei TaxID=1132659 RepID=A0ABT8YGC2_9HYPH|nr:sulfotransferase [Rhizobium alvei]MDO6962699.1 sulfotransferase [Rhizobium alvei]